MQCNYKTAFESNEQAKCILHLILINYKTADTIFTTNLIFLSTIYNESGSKDHFVPSDNKTDCIFTFYKTITLNFY